MNIAAYRTLPAIMFGFWLAVFWSAGAIAAGTVSSLDPFEFAAVGTAYRTLGRRLFAFVNVTANLTAPFGHHASYFKKRISPSY
jgi:hypothetical protein